MSHSKEKSLSMEFNPEKHEYRVNGVVVPSVSEIIKEVLLLNVQFSGDTTKMDIGTKAHLTTQYYDNDELDESDLHPTLQNYLQAWKSFKKDFNPKFELIETMFYHKRFRYAGTIDRYAVVNGSRLILDIKTGREYVWHPIQLEGYKFLLEDNGYEVDRTACVYLTPEGTYKYREHKSPNLFLACLSVYNFKKTNKLL